MTSVPDCPHPEPVNHPCRSQFRGYSKEAVEGAVVMLSEALTDRSEVETAIVVKVSVNVSIRNKVVSAIMVLVVRSFLFDVSLLAWRL